MRAGLWAEESGPSDAELVVLVHGAMDRSDGLRKLTRRLDDRHHVLRYDRRGYGRSFPHDGPFGMDGQVDDLEGLLAGREALVFGHSHGGNVALATAQRLPTQVVAVAVYETPLSWLDWWPGTTAGADALATRGDPADAAERFIVRMIGDARWQRLPAATRTARRAEGVAMVEELADLAAHAPWDPAAIAVPVVAMRGTEGAPHHLRSTEHLAAVLPHCRAVDIDGARHFGPNTHPDDVSAVIVDLVSRVCRAR